MPFEGSVRLLVMETVPEISVLSPTTGAAPALLPGLAPTLTTSLSPGPASPSLSPGTVPANLSPVLACGGLPAPPDSGGKPSAPKSSAAVSSSEDAVSGSNPGQQLSSYKVVLPDGSVREFPARALCAEDVVAQYPGHILALSASRPKRLPGDTLLLRWNTYYLHPNAGGRAISLDTQHERKSLRALHRMHALSCRLPEFGKLNTSSGSVQFGGLDGRKPGTSGSQISKASHRASGRKSPLSPDNQGERHRGVQNASVTPSCDKTGRTRSLFKDATKAALQMPARATPPALVHSSQGSGLSSKGGSGLSSQGFGVSATAAPVRRRSSSFSSGLAQNMGSQAPASAKNNAAGGIPAASNATGDISAASNATGDISAANNGSGGISSASNATGDITAATGIVGSASNANGGTPAGNSVSETLLESNSADNANSVLPLSCSQQGLAPGARNDGSKALLPQDMLARLSAKVLRKERLGASKSGSAKEKPGAKPPPAPPTQEDYSEEVLSDTSYPRARRGSMRRHSMEVPASQVRREKSARGASSAWDTLTWEMHSHKGQKENPLFAELAAVDFVSQAGDLVIPRGSKAAHPLPLANGTKKTSSIVNGVKALVEGHRKNPVPSRYRASQAKAESAHSDWNAQQAPVSCIDLRHLA